jgi:hypothetical protein
MSYFLFQDFIERYCLIPVISQIEETTIIPTNKMIRKIPNSSSFSSVTKNEGCSSKKIESPTARGPKIMDGTEREKARTKILLVWINWSIKLSIKLMIFWRFALFTSPVSSFKMASSKLCF